MNDLTGQRFGRLLVLYDSGKRDRNYHKFWMCKCDCGSLKLVSSTHLKSGHTKSCGCLRKEIQIKNGHESKNQFRKKNQLNYKHGGSYTRIYEIWHGMKKRCYGVKSKDYKYYGKKGVEICKDWKDDYMAFKNWALSSGYKDDLTIDRIDNAGNYEPSNCQWLTNLENVRKGNQERNKKSQEDGAKRYQEVC